MDYNDGENLLTQWTTPNNNTGLDDDNHGGATDPNRRTHTGDVSGIYAGGKDENERGD